MVKFEGEVTVAQSLARNMYIHMYVRINVCNVASIYVGKNKVWIKLNANGVIYRVEDWYGFRNSSGPSLKLNKKRCSEVKWLR